MGSRSALPRDGEEAPSEAAPQRAQKGVARTHRERQHGIPEPRDLEAAFSRDVTPRGVPREDGAEQQTGHERGEEVTALEDLEPRCSEKGREPLPVVSPMMAREFVDAAPEPAVRRDRQDDPPARPKHAADTLERERVLADVLEDVEERHDVEVIPEGRGSEVELVEAVEPVTPGVLQAAPVQLAERDPDVSFLP
jgi:hypothetical protein